MSYTFPMTRILALSLVGLFACGCGDDSGQTGDASPEQHPDVAGDINADTNALDGPPGDAPTDGAPQDTIAEGSPPDGTADGSTNIDECQSAGDCTACAYQTAPASEAECYCVACAIVVMTTARCASHQAAWLAQCTAWAARMICPEVLCTAPPEVGCNPATMRCEEITTRGGGSS